MAALTVQIITIEGLEPTLQAADVGLTETFTNNGNQFAKVFNGSGAPITVTPTVTGSISTGETIENTVVTIPAGETRDIGPFSVQIYSQTVTLTLSADTSVTVGAFSLPRQTQSVVAG